jgi:hypothetical protein
MAQSETSADAAAPTREQIDALQIAMATMPQDEVPLTPWNTFGPGFYARTIAIPRGSLLVGKVHADEHIFILSKGELALVSEDGRSIVKAPFYAVGRPGMKRIGFAITDCVCTNVHINADDERDLGRLEARYITPEPHLPLAQSAMPELLR